MQRNEQAIHQTVVAHLKQRGVPGLVFFHVPNGAFLGGKRVIQGSIMDRSARAPAWPDLILLRNSNAYALGEPEAEGGRPPSPDGVHVGLDQCRRVSGALSMG